MSVKRYTYSQPAVLVFARGAEAEAYAKPCLGQPSVASRAAATSLQCVKRAVAASQLPAVYCGEADQRGDTFAERITAAVVDVFTRGYSAIIVIGGDCPELETEDLLTAASSLRRGRSALGRDHRGGAYLLGFRREDFCASTFLALPWCSHNLARAFVQLGCGGSAPLELVVRRDVNDAGDLRVVARRLSGLRAWSTLGRITESHPAGFYDMCGEALGGFGESRADRGPPVLG